MSTLVPVDANGRIREYQNQCLWREGVLRHVLRRVRDVPGSLASAPMDRPSAFSENRFLGDKRTQQVYDLDEVADEEAMAVVLDELMSAETFICFGPDTLAEARNRGYRLRSV